MTERLSSFVSRRELVFAFLLVSTALIHGSSLFSWWTYDDPQLLIQARYETVASTLFEPSRWQIYSSSNFVPLLPLSLKIDVLLWGFEPTWFYAHHLLAIAVGAFLLYLYARRFTSPLGAALAGALFLVLPVTSHASHMLMLRHYCEGLILALLALIAWDRRDRTELYSIGAAVAYFFAILAKEIYAPLPLLMIAHSIAKREPLQRVFVGLIAPSIAALVYVPWRFSMLSSVGGYTEVSITEAALNLVPTVLSATFGSIPGWMFGLWLALLSALALMKLRGVSWRHSMIAILIAVYLTLPLFPVVSNFEARHAFAVSAIIAFLTGVAAQRIGIATAIIIASILVIATAAGRVEDRVISMRDTVMITEGRYIWESEPTNGPLFGTSGVWYLDGLRYLREKERREEAPTYYLSTLGAAIDEVDPKRIVSAVDWPRPEMIERLRSTTRFAPLPATLTVDGRALYWQVPDDGASWYLLSPAGYELFRLETPEGMVMLPFELWAPSLELERPLSFRVVRRAEDGISVVTPPVTPTVNGPAASD